MRLACDLVTCPGSQLLLVISLVCDCWKPCFINPGYAPAHIHAGHLVIAILSTDGDIEDYIKIFLRGDNNLH